jgi:exopolyphosphatase / guanosine-5'-triphosphate,3'-diphosphate pyrophosphatase
MRKASIDIGTNSVLLLVAEMDGENLHILRELQEVPRLGKGVDKNRNLHPDSQQRVIAVLKNYQNYLDDHYPETTAETIVTATSAARDAANRDQFLRLVKKETGWDVRLLSGREEAEITYRGALSVLNGREKTKNVILDIGGGSTEIAYGNGYNLADGFSADMGSVRFTERFLTEYYRADASQKN